MSRDGFEITTIFHHSNLIVSHLAQLVYQLFNLVLRDYLDDGTPSELKVVEAFTAFIEVEDSSAIGLHKLITNSIQQKELDIKNCREQEYDGREYFSLPRRSKMWLHMLTTCIVLRTT